VCKYGTWLRKGTVVNQLDETNPYGYTVERLYCKRPIQCLASSKILTPPHRPHRPASVYFGAGGRTHSLGGECMGGVNILEDTRHCSVLYIHKYFVGPTVYTLLMRYELQQNFPPSGGKNWFINRRFLYTFQPRKIYSYANNGAWLIFGSEKGKMETRIVSLLSEQGTFSLISHGSEIVNI
jgi:hypothetical protein